MARKEKYNEGMLRQVLLFVAETFHLDGKYLWATLIMNFPALRDEKKCFNCGASMQEYVFRFGALDGLLLLAMARQVKRNAEKGMGFTEANKVHVPSLKVGNTIHDRTTISSKLGLVTKVLIDKKHKGGFWLITRRGWLALRGEEVPLEVHTHRNEIVQRSNETITLQGAFNASRAKMERYKNRKSAIEDHRDVADSYRKEDWFGYGEIHEEPLL